MKLVYVLMVALLWSSCNKEQIDFKPATIYFHDGNDDCDGYLIYLDSIKRYQPVNLPVQFQKNGLKVNVEYSIVDTFFSCGFGGTVEGVKISFIESR